ncbi:protein FAM151B [Aplochiton taeniatus]
MSDQTLGYFLGLGKIRAKDAAEIEWSHAANSQAKITEALQGPAHMIEADILMRGSDPVEPIMAHPPQTDSDINFRDWLAEVVTSDKGIKLDFKSLEAVAPSMSLLEEVRARLAGPVWINADILHGPGGQATPLEPKAFLEAVGPGSPGDVLSLGWTTGWVADTDNNPGYSWEMMRAMEEVCQNLKQPITFPVRAALLAKSFPQLQWLLQQLDRSSLTVWTGLNDVFPLTDLLPYRRAIDPSRIYYDLSDSQRSEFSSLNL